MGFVEEVKQKTAHVKNKYGMNDAGMLSTGSIIGLVIGVVILAALLPTAINAINDANTSGWDATQASIWGVLGIIIIAVVIMKITE